MFLELIEHISSHAKWNIILQEDIICISADKYCVLVQINIDVQIVCGVYGLFYERRKFRGQPGKSPTISLFL